MEVYGIKCFSFVFVLFSVDFVHMDLSSLKSVKDFAEYFLAKYEKLNILVNNGKTCSFYLILLWCVSFNRYRNAPVYYIG